MPPDSRLGNGDKLIATSVLKKVAKHRIYPPVGNINAEGESNARCMSIQRVKVCDGKVQWNDYSTTTREYQITMCAWRPILVSAIQDLRSCPLFPGRYKVLDGGIFDQSRADPIHGNRFR